jgi:hypothetical protein
LWRETVVDSVVPCQKLCLRLHSCEFGVEWDGVTSRNGERTMWRLSRGRLADRLADRLVDRLVGRLDGRLDGRVSTTLSTSPGPLLSV